MNILNMRGLVLTTSSGSKFFAPAGGPIQGDNIVSCPVSSSQNVVLSFDANATIEEGDQVAVLEDPVGFFVFKPLYPTDPEPQPPGPGPNPPVIVLLQKITSGVSTKTGIGPGTRDSLGAYSVYWDGLGDLYISGAPDSLEAFSVDDSFRLSKCYGALLYPALNGSSEGPLLVTDDQAGGQRFFKKELDEYF